jgi:coiled-coil domain-containing protein 130
MQPFNKYYPPDWTPEKGSVNKFVGKHPLGDRARKIDQGILIVRFAFSHKFRKQIFRK